MANTFKVLSALLTYPTAELQHAAGELRATGNGDALLPRAVAKRLQCLIDEIATGDLYDLQERYVLLFDRTRSLSLHLFEHVHGESRDRGQAMIDLKNLYESNGLTIGANELPDFLPLFLEFLSTCRREQAIKYLSEVGDIIAGIGHRLRKRSASHAPVLEAIASLVLQDHDVLAASLNERERDDSPAALDIAWEEAPVTFNDLVLPDAEHLGAERATQPNRKIR